LARRAQDGQELPGIDLRTRDPGTAFIHQLVRQPYGLAEFTVRDCDGRVITFGGQSAE